MGRPLEVSDFGRTIFFEVSEGDTMILIYSSDGSEEWTPYWMKKFNHKFGDDGIFWISFENFLEEFPILHRTRLFDETWNVVQRWTLVFPINLSDTQFQLLFHGFILIS